MINFLRCGAAGLLAIFSSNTFASARVFDIGDAPAGPLVRITNFVQDVVNTLAGPGVFAVGFVSLLVVVVLWVFAPKAGPVMAMAMRVAIGVIVLLNIPLWFTYLSGTTSGA